MATCSALSKRMQMSPNKALQADASKCHAPCMRKGRATFPRR